MNLDIFLAAIQRFLAEKQGDELTSVPTQCTETNLCNEQDGNLATHKLESSQCTETYDHKTTSLNTSEKNTIESSGTSMRDDDLGIFLAYEKRFGRLKEQSFGTFRDELARLGVSRVGDVLERCATRCRSWKYVATALANEQPIAAQAEFITYWGEGVDTGVGDADILHLRPLEADLSDFVSKRVVTLYRRKPFPGPRKMLAAEKDVMTVNSMTVWRAAQKDSQPPRHQAVGWLFSAGADSKITAWL